MREIKFRAWDAKEKQMLEVNHLFNLDNEQPIDEEQIAFDAKFASGKIVKDIISDTTGDVLKVKVFFNSGDNRQLEDAMNLKALLEKYGTQLFK